LSSPPHPITHPGLTSAEVAERVKRGESNAFKARSSRSYWEIVRDNVFNLFNIVLFTLLLIVLLLKDYGTVFFAGFSVVSNTFLGMLQEISAKRKLDQLAALTAQQVSVWRDGKLVNLPMAQLVKDDVIPIKPGDRMVVDGRLLEADALEMDESHLTGESDAVLKEADAAIFSGSFCIAGTGTMLATKVGKESTINRLSTIAKAYKRVVTPSQQKINILVQISVGIMLICGPMLFLAGVLNHLPTLQVFRNAVVFVSSVVPQGLVLTAILSLTIGAIKITRHQTLIQRVNAVESLANVTVLCFDKTGTLTRNQLAVTDLLPLDGSSPDEVTVKLHGYVQNLGHRNSTAAAIAAYSGQVVKNGSTPQTAKLREIPFTSARKWGAIVLPEETLILGAPERVLSTESHEQAAMIRQAQQLSENGLRVLAFARADRPPQDGRLDHARQPLALVVMSDRVREDIRETLDAFRAQDVRLKVISGDNVETVRAIAGQAGMPTERAYSGDQLQRMSDPEFAQAAQDGDLFARIEPDTKRRLVAALKSQGEYVAMVGDGVNDVPALKEANLAVSMNDGAQISKDVADIVLLNNAMSTLPLAFKEGRSITQVIFGTSKMFLVKNMYSLLFFIFAGFMSLPFPINPIQVSWVTFGTVNIPGGLIALGILRPAYMKRFRHDVLDYVITGGIIGAAAMALLYAVVSLYSDLNQDVARSTIMMFTTLFSTLILWNIHGVDVFLPRTIIARWRVFLMGLIFAVLTIITPYIAPALPPVVGKVFNFEFVPLTVPLWVLTALLFVLTAVLLHLAMRSRIVVSRFWNLSAP